MGECVWHSLNETLCLFCPSSCTAILSGA